MKVFICHSTEDRWVARKISEELEKIGVETFLDAKDMKTGESIDDSIKNHLADCDELVLIMSPSSLKSHWVFMEVGGANALGKKIVPILFHIGINEIPQPITNYLARDINEIDKYYDEVEKRLAGKKVEAMKPERKILKRQKIEVNKGDDVKIIDLNLLSEDQKDRPPKWVPQMNKYSGKKAKIRDVINGFAKLDIDEGEFTWSPEWLEK